MGGDKDLSLTTNACDETHKLHVGSSLEQGPSLEEIIGHIHDKVKFVWGNVNNRNLEWLRQSIVAEKATPINFAEVSNSLLGADKRVVEVRE